MVSFSEKAKNIVMIPNLIAPLSYIHFLRYFKRKNPTYGLGRLIQEAFPYWAALTVRQKHLVNREHILLRLSRSVPGQKKRLIRLRKSRKCRCKISQFSSN